jgi:hypothetical protein
MRQKYMISRDGAENRLKIREYAIIEKNPKNMGSEMLNKERFTFLCEETYESKVIMSSIALGIKVLVRNIRTHNIFPIGPNATKIAESVIALYKSPEDGSVDLFFDDLVALSD